MARRKNYGSPPEAHARDARIYGRHAHFLLRSARHAAGSGRCAAAISQLVEAGIAVGKMAANRHGSGVRKVYSGAERAVAKSAHAIATKCARKK